jgi:DNA polymerase-3 subunit chi
MDEHDVLINLADQLPSFFSRFERLIECVDHDPEVKQASRSRFKYYRDHGYPLNTHTVP